MNWLHSQFTSEQYRDDLRAAERQMQTQALLAQAQPETDTQNLRHMLGEKLVEWGQRLQDETPTVNVLHTAKG